MAAKKTTTTRANRTATAVLDLDHLAPEVLRIKIGGEEYALVPFTLEKVYEYKRLTEELAAPPAATGKDPAEVRILSFLAPTLPRDKVLALGPDQANAIIEHWASAAGEAAGEAQADAAGALANPILPG